MKTFAILSFGVIALTACGQASDNAATPEQIASYEEMEADIPNDTPTIASETFWSGCLAKKTVGAIPHTFDDGLGVSQFGEALRYDERSSGFSSRDLGADRYAMDFTWGDPLVGTSNDIAIEFALTDERPLDCGAERQVFKLVGVALDGKRLNDTQLWQFYKAFFGQAI